MEGQQVAGRYRLQGLIGSGAMGQVWRAQDERLLRQVAVKVVDLDTTTQAAVGERFHREAIAAAQLNHPNIVTIFDAGTDGSSAYLVMELLPGMSLAQLIRTRGPLPVPDAARIAGQVARALEATHAIGVVHRDIKPANIMVHGESVKLLDFGIAQLAADASAQLTAPATTIGTAAFMSPEQARGLRAGPASDVYSLGCVLMTMLTGEPPFPGDNSYEVAGRQINELPPLARSRRPGISWQLNGLVARMLDKDPARRPTAVEVVRALREEFEFAGAASAAPPSVPATAVLPAGATAVGGTALGAARSGGVAGDPHGHSAPVGSARPSPVRPDRPGRGGQVDPRRYRRAAQGIGLAIVAILVVMIVWAFGSHLVGQLTAAIAPSSEPTRTPTAAPTSAQPRNPLPSISLPSISLPSMPSLPSWPAAGEAALQAAVGAVGIAIDAINADDAASRAAKRELQSAWSDAADDILSGQNPGRALDRFEARLVDARDEEAIAVWEHAAISLALRAVGAAV